ncbi:MAG: hypothetical protein HC881_16065 [Leptolyngbyaceae cyanobacterium SL_7_1]|nr:hypothetical protein [Leptolyngbyaceae cyanobacterium SL_7_1]
MTDSPKSFNIWNYKPWWCQPWSIVLTSVVLIGGSWGLFHRWWVAIGVAIPVLTWMVYFLLIYPRMMAQMLAEAEERAIEPS